MGELFDLNLYDVNKRLMDSMTSFEQKQINHYLAEIATWFSYVQSKYFMLLCHERRDYTLFHFANGRKRYHEAGVELFETLQNRGEILDITYEADGAYAIWVRINEENFLYYLFPYDTGVIEV